MENKKQENSLPECESMMKLLAQRRSGKFITAAEMDDRLARMLSRKRQIHHIAE